MEGRERTADRRRAERAAKEKAARSPAPGTTAVLAMGVAAILVVVLIRLAFPGRSDYAGHFLAGTGATAGALAVVEAFRRLTPNAVLALCVACIVAGFGTESTIFREAAFDWVDFAVQSSGAVLAATAFLGSEGGRRSDLALGLGFVLFIGGCGFAFG